MSRVFRVSVRLICTSGVVCCRTTLCDQDQVVSDVKKRYISLPVPVPVSAPLDQKIVLPVVAELQVSAREVDSSSTNDSPSRTISNWSGTHSVSPSRIYEPESLQDLILIMQDHHEKVQLLT